MRPGDDRDSIVTRCPAESRAPRAVLGCIRSQIELIAASKETAASTSWTMYRTLTVVMEVERPTGEGWWQYLLHNQTALLIKGALLLRRGVIVTDVPYHLAR